MDWSVCIQRLGLYACSPWRSAPSESTRAKRARTGVLATRWSSPPLPSPLSSTATSPRLPRGRAACPKPVHKGLGPPGVTVQLRAKLPGSSAQGRGHTARFPNMTKLQTMALPASARLNALPRASGGGGIKRFCGNGGGATAAATRKASTRSAWAREAHPSPAPSPLPGGLVDEAFRFDPKEFGVEKNQKDSCSSS